MVRDDLHGQPPSRSDSPGRAEMDRLNSAVNAIKAGDINTLQLLLDQDAGLVN